MRISYRVAALCALVHMCAASPSCDVNSALVPCLMPIIGYAMTPEAQQLIAQEGDNLTEAQLQGLCKLGKPAITCVKDYVERCVDRSIPDIHDFARGTDGLMTVCDKPNMYADAKVLMDCNKKMDSSSLKYHACLQMTNDSVTAMIEPASDPQSALDLWKTGNLLRGLCCTVQKIRTCLGSEVEAQCGANAKRLDDSIYETINNAYNCQSKLSACPA